MHGRFVRNAQHKPGVPDSTGSTTGYAGRSEVQALTGCQSKFPGPLRQDELGSPPWVGNQDVRVARVSAVSNLACRLPVVGPPRNGCISCA